MRKILIIMSLALLMYPAAAPAWDALKTDQFTVFYEPAYKARALRLLSDIEYYKNIPEGIVGNKCGGLPIVLDDYGQISNGYANPVFYNMHIINYETGDADWLSFVSLHEYTHMIHMTRAGGLPSALTFLLGDVASPMLFSPSWTFEAITVYNESKMSKYMGRLNDGAFDSYMGICVSENKFPSIMKATYSPMEFPYGTGIYLFGSEFLNFLALTYGEDKLKKFYDSYSSSLGSYFSPFFTWLGIDRTFDEVFGGTTLTLWDKWQEYEKQKHKDYRQEGERITNLGGFTASPAIKGDRLYYVKGIVEKTGAFGARSYNEVIEADLKTGKSRTIISTTSNFTHPFRFSAIKMYYSVAETKPGFANKSNRTYGDFTVIYERDLASGSERAVLAGDIRTYFSPYEGKLIYARDDRAKIGSEIYEYNIETGENKIIADTDYLVLALDGDAERIFVEAKSDGENAGIYSFDRASRKFTPLVVTPYYESSPELYGDRLFFRANFGKIYSAYCYDPAKKKVYRLTENGSAGTPAYYEAGNEIYFIGATAGGFDVYKKKAEFKEYKLPADKPDFILPPLLDESNLNAGGYADNLATLAPKLRLPLAYYDGTYGEAGISLGGADAIGDFIYATAGIYDFYRNSFYYMLALNSNLLAPAFISVMSDNFDNGRIRTWLAFPLYVSKRPGLSGLDLSVSYQAFAGLNRRQLSPGISAGFNFPSFEAQFSAHRVFEGAWLGSNYINRQAISAGISLAQYVPDGKISLRGNYIYDPDNADDVMPVIRGYSDALQGSTGTSWKLDYTRPLVRIRAGLWLPINMYVEDLCGGVFFDSAFAAGTQYACGAELHLETTWFFVLPVDLGFRVSINKENEFKWNLLAGGGGVTF